MIACDGCGVLADDRHIRERIERLELATRFRPIHIQALLLDVAPPARPEDYFYRVATERSVRSAESRSYFDEMISCSGKLLGGEMQEESALDAFQRCGLFLTHAVECPIRENAEWPRAINRAAPTLLKRLQISYCPKFVAILSQPLVELIPFLQNAGWGGCLILDEGKPFATPFLGGSVWSSGRLAEGLRRALSSGVGSPRDSTCTSG